MTPLAALWLPIVLSAVIVFIASSIMHMVLPYHRSDYQKLADQDKVLSVLRAAGLKRGLYIFPFLTHKEMKSPAAIEKYNQGPVGMMTIAPKSSITASAVKKIFSPGGTQRPASVSAKCAASRHTIGRIGSSQRPK